MGPSSTASGATWPTHRPVVPPEKRPSVRSRTSLPRPAPLIAPVTASISRIPGPPFGPSYRMTTTSPAVSGPPSPASLVPRAPTDPRAARAVEHARGPLDPLRVDPRTLHPRTLGSERAAQDRDPAGVVDRLVQGPDDHPVDVRRRDVGQVLGHRPAGHGQAVTVQQTGVE